MGVGSGVGVGVGVGSGVGVGVGLGLGSTSGAGVALGSGPGVGAGAGLTSGAADEGQGQHRRRSEGQLAKGQFPLPQRDLAGIGRSLQLFIDLLPHALLGAGQRLHGVKNVMGDLFHLHFAAPPFPSIRSRSASRPRLSQVLMVFSGRCSSFASSATE